jgi:DNA modification methylase
VSPYIADADFTLYVGDVRAVLRELPDASVDCCVTSPPYWGLRDYGTGTWDGGDAGCDHVHKAARGDAGRLSTDSRLGVNPAPVDTPMQFREECGKCGATRVDRQIGLEASPDEFVAEMVAVFREVRRVLAPHGTLWLNLGDSYAGGGGAGTQGAGGQMADRSIVSARESRPRGGLQGGTRTVDVSLGAGSAPGLKPKDLCGIPWRVAFALQADGWYLRADIIWAKPNPMPESVTDRPTKAHEYVFLLSKQPRYFFDQEAVREANQLAPGNGWNQSARVVGEIRGDGEHAQGKRGTHGLTDLVSGRNVRSVWEIATQPYPDAHFATFPEALPERCIKAGCPEQVCVTCGEPRVRIVERELVATRGNINPAAKRDGGPLVASSADHSGGVYGRYEVETLGFTDCGHGNYRTGVVLDPFMGSGTTALVARRLGRRSVGVELNEAYAALCARRLQQLSLFAEEQTA